MQKYIPFSKPSFGNEEKKEIIHAMNSGWVTLGPKTKFFEEEFAKYIGVKYAVAVTSCTAALQLALLVSGIKEGDEVITTPFTFAATSNAIIHNKAVPIYVDIDPKTYNIDPDKIEEKITKKTKAILPVHYAGYPVDLKKIIKIANKYNLKVIEDAAHAVGTEYEGKKIGNHGNLTCFSFHPIKNMTTGDGGMITTDDPKIAERLSQLRLHGMNKDAWKRHDKSGSWMYDVLEPGFKYNMTDFSAAMGIHQLNKLDNFIAARKKYAEIYNEAFKDIPEIKIPADDSKIRHSWNLYTIQIDTSNLNINRDEIIEKLKENNIGVSVYFIPLHYFTFFKNLGIKRGSFPVTEALYEKIISLPVYPKMLVSEVKFVAKTIIKLIKDARK